jgi:hypothetical protein
MSAAHNGGPAYPQQWNDGDGQRWEHGMTLRDYFAAKALAMKFDVAGSSAALDEHAENCYAMADAMLKAREV